MITGIHAVSDLPRTEVRKSWEVLLQIFSIKTYNANFGPVHLYCDSAAYKYYEDLGILDLYEKVEMIDESFLKGIDNQKYFAGAKILAELQCDLDECIFLDMDLAMTNSEIDNFLDTDVCSFYHRETTHVYGVDYEGVAINCAFNYWKDKDLRRKYAAEAIRLMREGYFPMIFIEQYTLAKFIKEENLSPNYFISNIWNTKSNSWDGIGNYKEVKDSHYHVWGRKDLLHNDPLKAADLTINLITILDEYEDIDLNKILTLI